MERRKFVIGLGALAAGGTAALGAGAFDSVEADRDVSVEIADDADAYLALTAERDDIISDDGGDGTLSLDLGAEETEEGGQGFNDDAVTEINDVFTVENQGTQNVDVSLGEDDVQDGVDFELPDDTELTPGGSLSVSVTVNTLDEDPEEDDGTLVIEAEA